jgi:hypothetical protein
MRTNIFLPACLITAACCLCNCKKTAEGFLSENIYYKENPLIATQGALTVSQPLEVDGSTSPMNVTLLRVIDKATGESVDSLMLKELEIPGFTDVITYADSTVESVMSKITVTKAAPLSVNKIGGRIQLTSATQYVPAGNYSIDVAVSNVRGNKTIVNACDINILPTEFFILPGAPYSYLLDTFTQGRIYTTPEITAARNTEGPAVITIKWIDENGNVFNPAAGEVLTRPGLASFENWDPYYDVELTDTAFVFPYPDHVPEFPVFNPALVGTGTQTDYWCYYSIPARFIAEPNQELRTGFAFMLPNAVGSYNVTIKVIGGHKK